MAVGDHAIKLDARSNAANVGNGFHCGRHSLPVIDAGIEYMHFVTPEVLGGEDLDVAEAVADSVFAQTVDHVGEVSTRQKKTGDASAHHEEGHDRAAAVAKDVAERKKQKLTHDLPPGVAYLRLPGRHTGERYAAYVPAVAGRG